MKYLTISSECSAAQLARGAQYIPPLCVGLRCFALEEVKSVFCCMVQMLLAD